MSLNKKNGKSPSTDAMIRTANRATLNGGVTQDFSANVDNIREISRKLNYNILQDASFVYVPSSYGESKNFAQVQNKRNLLQWSEEFDNAIWNKINSSISPNIITAPNGTLTADGLIENTSNTQHYISTSTALIFGAKYTESVYLKYKGRQWVLINAQQVTGHVVWFDVLNGVVGTILGTNVTANIQNAGNGWFKCSITLTADGNGGGISVNPTTADNVSAAYVGDGISGVYIWGEQLELGAYATPYQKTVAAGDGIVDFNFTRATSATVTNKQGVIEDSCYNLLQRSEEFDNAIWNKGGITISANSNTAPNTTITSDRFTETTASTLHYATQPFTTISGTSYCASYYVLKYTGLINTRRYCFLHLASSGSAAQGRYTIVVDLQTGVVTSSSNIGTPAITGTNSKIEDVGLYWRISIIGVINFTSVGASEIGLSDSSNPTFAASNQPTYTGDNVSFIVVWGAQLTQGSTPRPYLRTTNRLNVPKLDYSRSLLEPSLLIERQATNLLGRSNEFVFSDWAKGNTTVTANNSIVNCFGNNVNTDLADNTVSGQHYFGSTISYTSGNNYTTSYYIKKADVTWIQFQKNNPCFGQCWVNFNFDTGLFGNNGGIGTWSAKQLVNGFWKIIFTATAIGSFSQLGATIIGINNINTLANGPSYIASGAKLCTIAGIQEEVGLNATTYIPTVGGSTVTRNADTSYVDLWNNALLNKDNFTLYCEGYNYAKGNSLNFAVGDTTNAGAQNALGFYNGIQAVQIIGGVVTVVGSSLNDNTSYKFLIQRNGTSVNFFRNGVQIGTTQTIPVFDYRYLDILAVNSTYAIDKIALFNRTLTDAECIKLTT